ncbi:ribulokinase [Terrilactibacillus sp. BCM23-1]|uniref:Ribulokinase n=1 Tax=Terrilactibacillus tamarindi TaxID=2599694 RepID=A0A6N8CT14_9BACI|nr:ribulokinase [Terrilactibacillus tamarindi]MTT32337.1 ribulokinase [Terrilactibacillus tamarindi]
MTTRYTIGLDFGTLSCRAVLVDISNGDEIATSVKEYEDGVIDKYLPGSNQPLGKDWALQNPDNYLDVLISTVKDIMQTSGVDKSQVIGIGIDFTSCTMMPIDKEGNVLCQKKKYQDNPHAWVKLWKHHAAWPEADKLNQIARKRGERFIKRFNNGVSSEWFIPKVWQILNEAPDIYQDAYKFIEAADWIVLKMTGKEVRSSCTSGYKAMWSKKEGFPSTSFFKALDPRLEHVVTEKMSTVIHPVGTKAGGLTSKFAKVMGLEPGTAVAVGMIDAHVAVPALNVTHPNEMVMIMGTSTCHIVLSDKERFIPGISSVVEDAILPGIYAYEAGQSATGDMFDWFARECVPAHYEKEARSRGINIHQLLEEKALKLQPGESGLLALDWWNGSRLLSNDDLSGAIIGLSLGTKPEAVYRSLIEATAFGTRHIIESFQNGGIDIKVLRACGGLSLKNNMLMQIYADVTNMEITVGRSLQTPALGSAMYGAAAAGIEKGGYGSIYEASKRMSKTSQICYRPIKENVDIYHELYSHYKDLCIFFSQRDNPLMKVLRQFKN